VVYVSRIPLNPQLGVAIISRIACGTPNLSKKKKKNVNEQHYQKGWPVSYCTLLCNVVGYARFWATHFSGHRSDVGRLHQWVENNPLF
jgi:hypothetical protein